MDEISVALISLGVSTAVSLAIYLLGYKQNFSQHYSTTISNERMVWIKEMRKLSADFLAFCETNDKLNKKNVEEFNKLKNEILINLNSNAKKYKNDAIIRSSLMKPFFEDIKKDLPEIRNAFIEIFKNEWDKAKLEAGRSKYQVIRLERKSKKLTEYFKINEN